MNAGKEPFAASSDRATADVVVPEPGVAPPTALTIAGSDSGGAAGLQADLRTFFSCGVHGLVAVTAVTVQNTLGVHGRSDIPADIVAAQIDAVAADMGINAGKTGMLASAEIIGAVAGACRRLGIGRTGRIPFVVDPVAASMHGVPLFDELALDALRTQLLPLATLATPNLDEVRLLTGIDVRSRERLAEAAVAIHALGPEYVLVKGGHLTADADCVDVLYDGSGFLELVAPRVDTIHTHGSGDTLASAITAALARGATVPAAVLFGKHVILRSVRGAYPMGEKVGPVSTFWRLRGEPVMGADLVEELGTSADGTTRRIKIR